MTKVELFEPTRLDKVLRLKIEDLGISPKVEDTLRANDITTIEELCFNRKTEVLSLVNIGEHAITELVQVLADLGLTFMSKGSRK